MFEPIYSVAKGERGTSIEFTIFTELKESKYKVFSSYIENPNVKSIIPILNNKTEYKRFMERAKQKSTVTYDTSPTVSSKMITLSTCDTSR